MNVKWFEDQNHLVYLNAEKELEGLEKRLKLPGLERAAQQFRAAPTEEGLTLKGLRRTSAKLFIPDLTFKTHIDMGENVFLYMGEMSECYVIFWPDGTVQNC